MRVQRQIDQLLAQRAAEWVDVLKSGNEADHVAFLEWMRESKLHVEHYLETEALDRQLRQLGAADNPNTEALLTRIAPAVARLNRADASGSLKTSRSAWPIAATVAALSIGTAALWGWSHVRSDNRVNTAVGEQRNVTLSDGSRVFVNASSNLRIDYSSQERHIELSSGEAVFRVAREAGRPFIVSTKTADIRAIGTEFNVYQRPDRTALVSVIEGRVQITRTHSSGTAQIENLGVGEEAQVTAQRIERREHPDVTKTTGWRQGRLYFDETPLTEMVQEFNRYGGPLRFELEGGGFEHFRFGGVFNANEPGVLVDILEKQKDLYVERRPDGVVEIRSMHDHAR